MTTSPQNRSRLILPAPKAPTTLALEFLKRSDVWIRVSICFVTALSLYVVFLGWHPPFSFRVREAPLRDLHARTKFKYPDSLATEQARTRARQKILCLYQNDPRPLEELRQALVDDLFELTQSDFEDAGSTVWPKFTPPAEAKPDTPVVAEVSEQVEFEKFKSALLKDERLEKLQSAINISFLNIDKLGILKNLTHEFGQGSMQEIKVFPRGSVDDAKAVPVASVRAVEVSEQLRRNLIVELAKIAETVPDSEVVAQRLHNWFDSRLPVTLTWDEAASRLAGDMAAEAVDTQYREYAPGDPLVKQVGNINTESTVIAAGVPLDATDISLLWVEHEAYLKNLDWSAIALRSLVFFGLFAAVFSLTSGYLFSRDRQLLVDTKQFATLIGLMFTTLFVCRLVSLNPEGGGRLEVIPIVLFSMIIAIAYNIELSIILSALVALAFTVAQNFGVGEFVVLTAASSSSALLCRTIRSRTKLFYVGIMSAAAVFPTVIGVEYMLGQPFGASIVMDAVWFSGCAALAGVFMTVLLPFFERLFDIQTDISLLELSDANHPLLRELVQRAPGTYNHSINVASISEAAAESIDANGLLCRVAAYFHDVGKLRKPEYFIENQAGGANKHDDLVPSMSTLVIIAHVKDGAEIGRTHRLPQRIIDMIEQHHGTTLVEYFYRRAAQQNEEGEENGPVEEADFRYPGPKPQTPEAAVMMLADAVESASRALREPTPARIENLVRELTKKRLDDGQFDECPITVEELNTIQKSLIKSLTAMYHSRVKYPDQQSA